MFSAWCWDGILHDQNWVLRKVGCFCGYRGRIMVQYFIILVLTTCIVRRVVEIEAERLEEVREEREKFLRDLEQYVEEKKSSSKGRTG